MKCYLFFIIIIFSGISNQSTAQKIALYTDGIPGPPPAPDENLTAYTNGDIPTLEVFLPEKERSNGSAIIIFPGGGYMGLAYQEEGSDIGALFAKQGIAAFVVKYRLPMGYRNQASRDPIMSGKRYMVPLQDAQQAIKRVRMNAAAWHLDTSKIGIIGFSAGGHVASSLGTHFNQVYIPNKENTNLRPDFMMLVYPVISMKDELTHGMSKYCLLGTNPSPEKVQQFSNEDQVTSNTPPTYLTHAGDDGLVKVDNSIVFYQALVKHQVPAEMHLYPKGDHSFVLSLPPAEWMTPIFSWMKKGGWAKNLYQ